MRSLLLILAIATALLAAERQPAKVDPAETFATESGQFDLPCTLPGNPTVTCYWIRPTGGEGRPAAAAGKDAVSFFHYPNQREFWKSGLFVRLAKESGLTVFGVCFANLTGWDTSDHRTCYYYPESGSGEAVLAAWRELRHRLDIDDRKLLVTGESGGASAAGQFAACHPEAVESAAFVGGKWFHPPPAGTGSWMVACTRRDVIQPRSEELDAQLSALGAPHLFVTTQPEWPGRANPNSLFFHVPNEISKQIIQTWLQGIAQLRAAHGGVVPPAKEWPAAVDPRTPTVLLATADPARQDPSTLFFPSVECHRRWLQVPTTPIRIQLPGASPTTATSFLLAPPAPAAKPVSLVVYLVPDEEGLNAEHTYNVDRLADAGHLVVAIDREQARRRPQIFAAALARVPAAAGCSVQVIGFGPQAEDAGLFVQNEKALKVTGRVFFDLWPDNRDRFVRAALSEARRGAHVGLVVASDREQPAQVEALRKSLLAPGSGIDLETETAIFTNPGKLHAARMDRVLAWFGQWSAPRPRR